jgi:hypothetical protein
MSSGKRYRVGIFDDTCMLTMTITCLRPKSSSMRFGYSYFTGHETFNYDLLSIYFIIILALTLTTQDAYDGGNEISKLVSIIIFGGLKTCNHYFPPRRAFLLILC